MVERGEEAVVEKTARVVEEVGVKQGRRHRETRWCATRYAEKEVEVEDDRATATAMRQQARRDQTVEADERVAPVRTGTR